MQIDTANQFTKFIMDEHELKAARSPNVFFCAYLQSKIADYALAAVELQWRPGEDPAEVLLQHEKLKAQVEVLQELQRELNIPTEQPAQSPT